MSALSQRRMVPVVLLMLKLLHGTCPPPLSPNSCRVMLGSLMEELLNAFLAGLNLWVGGGNAIFVASNFNLKELILAPCGMSVYPCFEADG